MHLSAILAVAGHSHTVAPALAAGIRTVRQVDASDAVVARAVEMDMAAALDGDVVGTRMVDAPVAVAVERADTRWAAADGAAAAAMAAAGVVEHSMGRASA